MQASHCGGFSCWGAQALGARISGVAATSSVVVALALECVGFGSCAAWASLFYGMWNLPGPGIEPIPCNGRKILVHCTTRDILYHILDSTYKWYHMVLVFLFLTYSLSMIISRSLHVAANGIISSFYMAE